MPFLSIHEAIGYALLGIDPAAPLSVRSELDLGGKLRGMLARAFDGAKTEPAKAQPLLLGKRQWRSSTGVRIEIPVYHIAPRGHRASDTWPCVSYELTGFEFAPERYIYKADTFRTPVKSSMTTVTINGKTVVGPSLVSVRENPDPYDLIFSIDVWAKHDHDALLLNKSVLEVFPARGALKAVQQDGTARTWEMGLRGVHGKDDPEVTLEDQLEHGCHWSYVYGIETFLDNTMLTQLRRTVTSFDMDVEEK